MTPTEAFSSNFIHRSYIWRELFMDHNDYYIYTFKITFEPHRDHQSSFGFDPYPVTANSSNASHGIEKHIRNWSLWKVSLDTHPDLIPFPPPSPAFNLRKSEVKIVHVGLKLPPQWLPCVCSPDDTAGPQRLSAECWWKDLLHLVSG